MTISDLIQIILMGLLVIVTGIYAWRTFAISNATKKQADATKQQADAGMKMADEMKTQTKSLKETISLSVRPSISIEFTEINGGDNYPFEPPSEIYLEIQNTGKGPARNLVITCEGQGGKVEYSKKELPSLNINEKRQFAIFREDDTSDNKIRIAYVIITAHYNDELGEIWVTTLAIDRKEGEWEAGEIITERPIEL